MIKGYRIAFLLLCLVLYCYADDATSDSSKTTSTQPTWLDKLKKDLLTNYDRNARPTQYYNVTNLDLKMTIRHVDIDEENSVFSVYGWVKMTWSDDKLKWNPADYGNLELFRCNPDAVWKPDVVLYNNARGSDNLHYGQTNVIVYNTGEVLWVPPTDYHSFCELNLRMWPFDHQTCILKIGSWTFDGYKLNLTTSEDPEIDIGVPNNEWSIRKVTTDRNTVYYKCCKEPYIDIQYNVTLQRHSSTHKAIVVSPAFVIILLALSVFWLPPQCGEKIILNGIIVLIVTVFLIYFAQQLPAMSGHTPLIVTFYSYTYYLVAISTILSVIVLRITRSKQCHLVPSFLKGLLDGCLGSVLGVGNAAPFEDDKEAASGELSTNLKQYDWCRLAVLLDRLGFVVYLIIFVISIIYFSL
ncbi:acetylcholine receptor subunit alpha-like 1 isoform X2 [Armigeres subalbatus]|uniref:acetylcholine receptor subunit alpha-like 1 isoform X2 n=1 Tax=Armigeres subalbatus TaxID=124917 RepID=UPI002ECFF7F0